MKHKYIITIAAAAMTISMSFSALAGVAGAGYNGSAATQNTGVNTQNSQGGTVVTDNGKYFNGPGWLWIGPYCYYVEAGEQRDLGLGWFTTGRILKNTTTPDGYQVDAEGRWVVNGVPQVDPEFGNVKMGMGDKYAGKSKDEVWALMKAALKDQWSQMYTFDGYRAYSESADTFIQGQMDPNYNGQSYYYGSNGTDAIRIRIPGYWWTQAFTKDTPIQQMSVDGTISKEIEKTIKTAIGDSIGQEFFNYFRAFADQNFQEFPQLVYDENGKIVDLVLLHKSDGSVWEVDENKNPVKRRTDMQNLPHEEEYYSYTSKTTKVIKSIGSGIEKLDLSAWKNRTTDYGKTFSITNDGYIIIYF